MQVSRMCLMLAFAAATACGDPASQTTEVALRAPAARAEDAVKFWESGASVYWNAVARDQIVKHVSSPFVAIRMLAILGTAQYNAVIAAENGKSGRNHPSPAAAVAAASAAALEYVYPDQSSALESLVASELAAPAWPGGDNDDPETGQTIGRSVAAQIIARATTDRFFAPFTGTVPVGPGLWFSSLIPPAPPVGAMFGKARTYFLDSGDQFRLGPPPAFGSPEYLAALGEVRHISDTRTAEQVTIANFWAFPNGTITPPGFWNKEASELAVRHRLKERDAAHLFALLNMAGFDAIVSCFDTKFAYWFIRPTQADPLITLVVALPNFPSYPSAHACVSGAQTTILGATFPSERQALDSMAEQAALSRVYGGLHYRFDGDDGLRLGRRVAGLALSDDVHGIQPFTLK